MRQTNNQLRMY
ncbi:hypothetical protein SMAC4_13619 [Sordaria macrospora]|nr:hypothetical protein SMAC4_13619 [Sordaria macrospora]